MSELISSTDIILHGVVKCSVCKGSQHLRKRYAEKKQDTLETDVADHILMEYVGKIVVHIIYCDV
jgi:hypothetical protein